MLDLFSHGWTTQEEMWCYVIGYCALGVTLYCYTHMHVFPLENVQKFADIQQCWSCMLLSLSWGRICSSCYPPAAENTPRIGLERSGLCFSGISPQSSTQSSEPLFGSFWKDSPTSHDTLLLFCYAANFSPGDLDLLSLHILYVYTFGPCQSCS